MFRTLIQPLVDFYETREPREQILLIFGTPIIIILLFYLAIWEPVFAHNNKLKKQLANEQRFAQWFQQQSQRISGTDKVFNWQSNNLPSVVEKTLDEFYLTPWQKRIFQNQRQETVVTFANIPYKKLIDWIRELNFKYQVVFRSLNLNQVETLGNVDAKLTLSTTHDKQGARSPFQKNNALR